uniref:alkaline phosphatase D family protein n=1 Tax=Thaumasiovibrio occultus TaxID=1891184 RepID=UPI000B35889E|nr:alkaline phosphatase D family protein [Thaumasiovibrio occultus]
MTLPLIIAGPILRRVTQHEFSLWLATTAPISGELLLQTVQHQLDHQQTAHQHRLSLVDVAEQIQIGERAWVVLIHAQCELPLDTELTYDVVLPQGLLSALVPTAHNQAGFVFRVASRVHYLLHGSCRALHDPCDDALATIGNDIADKPSSEWPDLLMMSGDQIYADHVCSPLMEKIHRVISCLGLYGEALPAERITHSDDLLGGYLDERDSLLPNGPKGKPIFSSTDVSNHLISLAEFSAMYLLVWSPTLWELEQTAFLDRPRNKKAQAELGYLTTFASTLSQVRTLLAHIPTYMIFDDHDVTDDWNLTGTWQSDAMAHPLTRQIISNGLLSYWLYQGWGNEPQTFDRHHVKAWGRAFKPAALVNAELQQVKEAVLAFDSWDYQVETTPKLIVLDTRTQRWHSSSRPHRPSGLMDWEALMRFQYRILDQDEVIIVSPAPMFGVKVIEVLQRLATWLRQPLAVDAENWMAHRGSANTLVSIFTHAKTPQRFVVLSGDVHYSFAYDIEVRGRKSSPNLFQITCSGFKNQFPEPLLSVCELADRWLFSPNSPLNWLTKRKSLRIRKRDPNTKGARRLVNASAVGEVRLNYQGEPNYIGLMKSNGERIDFPPPKGQAE